VSAYDNFFDLGGHSLIAIEALSRLERQLGVKLNPGLIRAQTLGQIAASYDELLRQAPAAPPAPAEEQGQPQAPGLAGRLLGAFKRTIVSGEKRG
jgi:hypothetical protein